MSTTQLMPVRSTLAGRWQIPVLGAAVLFLVGGVVRMAVTYHKVTFEEQLERVGKLREIGALARANAYLVYLLKDSHRTDEQRAVLHRLVAQNVYQAEADFRVHEPENARSIIKNFRLSVQYGGSPAASDWDAVGDAYIWENREPEAIDAYRQALRLGPKRSDQILRKLLELGSLKGEPLEEASIADLDMILESNETSPQNYLWALERKMDWLLDQGKANEALALVQKAKTHLNGTAHKLELTYSEALCLWRVDRRDEAEALLRSLRNEWTVHDELWGKSGWLLGRLEQDDGRPQMALAFYDEVLRSFRGGDLHDACALGRAECLGAVERFEPALEGFKSLEERLLSEKHSRYLDRDAVRTTITTIGESRLAVGQLQLGLGYMQLAKRLADPADVTLNVQYLSRIADASAQIALEAARSADTPEKKKEVKKLYVVTAENYVALAQAQTLDEEAAARAWTLAADNYDAAGQIDKVVELLAQFVSEHPSSLRRSRCLYRLGQAYQAVRRYGDAARTYQKVIREYPRLADAIASMVPMAECLMQCGADDVKRGVQMLVDIVDDHGEDALLTPQARDYRQALLRLAEYYWQADEKEVPSHWEKAISRLEDAIAMYPDDTHMFRLRFLLADAYRQSAAALAEEKAKSGEAAVEKEEKRRLALALGNYQEVKKMLAPQDADALGDLEQTYLRASYLYIGDCYFGQGKFEQAIEAYREAAWRYENLPTALSATMQVAHCYQRLGQPQEAKAAIARMQWILKKLPESAFDVERGMTSKAYWTAMAQRMETAGIY